MLSQPIQWKKLPWVAWLVPLISYPSIFPNFQVSPIGLVPEKHSNKFRTIFHLSFPKSGVTSIKYSVSKEDYSLQYITIDNAIEGILRLGQGWFLTKTDIESAFHVIPLHPFDYELFGMYWSGPYYYDKVLPFGLRGASYLFNHLSEAIEWILLYLFCLPHFRWFFNYWACLWVTFTQRGL